jgi:tungstate transport system ATP-binding protein
MTRLVELRDVKVERGGTEVLDVSAFHVDEAEVVCLIGPNGSGKSTLLLSLMGLLERAHGRLLYRGEEVRSARETLACRRRMAMVLQEPLLFDTTAMRNVAAGLEMRGVARGEVKRRARAALERLGVAHLAERSARKLSGGEARRVSLARALAVEPDALLLDEPFANLDPPTRASILDDLERTLAASRTAAVIVTHDHGEGFPLADRVVVMDAGKIVQLGTPAEVMNAPANERVASFVGMETILQGAVERSAAGDLEVRVAAATIRARGDARVGQSVSCGIRPENVTLHLDRPAAPSPASNVFPARVLSLVSSGPLIKVRLEAAFLLSAYITAESLATLAIGEGQQVFVSFSAAAVHLLPRADRG